MSKINFTAGGAPSRRLRVTPEKYRKSKGRPNISMSPGERPSTPFIPYKDLPVEFLDLSTQDNIVIPKGRAVSAITANNDADILGDGSTYNGTPKGVMGLVVPANGGVAREVTSPYDATTKTLPANYPIGIAEHDFYQDIAGDLLNYDMRSRYTGVLARSLVKLPCVDADALDTFAGGSDLFCDTSEGAPVAAGLDAASAYFAVSPKFGFLTIKNAAAGVAGKKLVPDFYGNWKPGTGVQSIARLMVIDYRFNKDLMDTVQSVFEENPAYRVAGTGTMGLPQFLYDFALLALKQAYIKAGTTMAAVIGTGGAYEGKDVAQVVLAAVQAGVFGYAWIQINV